VGTGRLFRRSSRLGRSCRLGLFRRRCIVRRSRRNGLGRSLSRFVFRLGGLGGLSGIFGGRSAVLSRRLGSRGLG
ncbi:MAG: hypothetical protein II700_06635, partial [Firmicutes bacterium]|nr:hypothetical protein [Bacillota bacterium]